MIFYGESNLPLVRYHGFRVMPFLVDLLLALAVAWLLAWSVDRLVRAAARAARRRKLGRERGTDPPSSMSVRWSKYLPRFPAILLMPTVLTACALLGVYQDKDRFAGWGSNFPLRFLVVDLDIDPFVPGEEYGWSIFGVWGFLVDTSLALAVAWALAMAFDRLLFPLARRLHRKKPEQGEPS